MSNKQNDIYTEEMRENFFEATPDKKEAIIKELKDKGFKELSEFLQAEYDEENELKEAEDKGSEDGVDKLQDYE